MNTYTYSLFRNKYDDYPYFARLDSSINFKPYFTALN